MSNGSSLITLHVRMSLLHLFLDFFFVIFRIHTHVFSVVLYVFHELEARGPLNLFFSVHGHTCVCGVSVKGKEPLNLYFACVWTCMCACV